MLTEENIGNYSITDVVYPLPGRQTVYPENEMKSLYVELMGKIQPTFFFLPRNFRSIEKKLIRLFCLAKDGISIDKKAGHFE